MAAEVKLFNLILIILFSISSAFCQLKSYPIASPILTAFYKDTNIILKYHCSEGFRTIVVKSVTLGCEPQNQVHIDDFKRCHPGHYEFTAFFEVSCNQSQTVLNTISKFEECKENEKPDSIKAPLSKRDIPSTPNLTSITSSTTTTHLNSPPTTTHLNSPPTTTHLNSPPTTTSPINDPDATTTIPYSATEPYSDQGSSRVTMRTPSESVYLMWIDGDVLVNDQDDTWELDYHSQHGYLLPTEWPLLIFYQLSLSLYVFFMAAWMVLCCVYRKDLLQVQYYIGFVILLGLIEKIIFVTEYEFLNTSGIKDNYGAVVFGEVVSALKRTAARILVVIVSVGFGIIIPRLGRTSYYLLAIALLYFPFACIDGIYTRKQSAVLRRGWMLVVGVVLVIIDTFICYWIFSALIQVMRKLRLRRNAVKLSIYRHFTNTLIFTMLAAVIYMVWFVITFQRSECNASWKEKWVDQAFWPFLFQLILLLIILLWRPSPSNNRYSYSALTDEVEDDESQEPMINDAYEGVKNRGKGETVVNKQETVEDTLKWVEDNIPKAADTIIPKLLDSDEEVENTLFEINKMQ